MKKILITGANGFIGSFLIEEACKNKYKVFAGVRKSSNLKNIKESNAYILKLDLSDKQSLKTKLLQAEKFDYIIHNAGITKSCKKHEFDKVNLTNTKNLIEALIETNRTPDRFIYISSLSAIGPGRNKFEPIKLTDKPFPVSIYGKSKLKTEMYIKSINDFPYLIFRPTGVYGPREKDYYVMYKSIKSGLETYIGSKNQKLSFIYVKDLTALIIKSLKSNIDRKTYFVSDLNDYTAKEFNTIVKDELGKKTISLVFPKVLVKTIAFISEKFLCLISGNVPTLNTEKYKDISQKNWLCNSLDLVSDFDFNPRYNLKMGIKETIEWYKKQGLL